MSEATSSCTATTESATSPLYSQNIGRHDLLIPLPNAKPLLFLCVFLPFHSCVSSPANSTQFWPSRFQGSPQCPRSQSRTSPFCLTVYSPTHNPLFSPPIFVYKKYIKTISKSTDFNFPRPPPYPNNLISQTSLHFHPFILLFPVFPLFLSHRFFQPHPTPTLTVVSMTG